jgi:hypothetical protein
VITPLTVAPEAEFSARVTLKLPEKVGASSASSTVIVYVTSWKSGDAPLSVTRIERV